MVEGRQTIQDKHNAAKMFFKNVYDIKLKVKLGRRTRRQKRGQEKSRGVREGTIFNMQYMFI